MANALQLRDLILASEESENWVCKACIPQECLCNVNQQTHLF